MRYWLYKDAKIIGPMSPREVLNVEGAGPHLLLCPEEMDGSHESDWKPAGEIPELADFFPERTPAVATALNAPESPSSPVGEFSSEELVGLPYFQSWDLMSGRPSRREEELDAQQRRTRELETKLAEFEAKISQYEKHQGEILDRLAEKDTLLGNREKEIQRLQKDIDLSRAQAAPKPGVIPSFSPPSREPTEKKLQIFEIPAAAAKSDVIPVFSPPPREPAEKTPQIFEIPAAISLPSTGYDPLFIQSFAPPTPLPTSVPSSPAVTPPPPMAAPSAAMSAAATPLPEPPSEGLEALAGASTPLPRPSVSSGYTPLSSGFQTPDPFSLPRTMIGTAGAPPNVPDFSWPPAGSTAQMEELAQFSAFAHGAPAQAAGAPPAPTMTAPSLPTPAATAPRRSGAKRLTLLAVIAAVGVTVGSLYLLKETKTTDIAPSGERTESTDGTQQPAAGFPSGPAAQQNPTSSPPASASPPLSAAPAPAPTDTSAGNSASPNSSVTGSASSGPSPETTPSAQTPETAASQNSKQESTNPAQVTDYSQEAIDLVKNYSLGGERGTIATWLQYSYPPGSQEKWSANPGDSAGTFMVQYQATQENSTAHKTESPVYVFQADVGRKSVKGFNRAAKELLAGAPSRKLVRKQVSKKKQRKHRALKPGEIPLLPLPSDAELPHTRHATVDEER